jgi:hypothetical protein
MSAEEARMEPHSTRQLTCRNCSQPLGPNQKFCGACSQKAIIGRLTLHDIAHDFLHAFIHVDTSVIALIRALITQPGYVARDFVEGKRKRHFGPFAFLVIAVGIATSLTLLLDSPWFQIIGQDELATFLQKHINVLFLVQTPILALFCWLLFKGARLFFAEHLILAIYTSGMRLLAAGLIAAPILHFTHANPSSFKFLAVYIGLWISYFGFAAAQFYPGKKSRGFVGGLIAAALTQFTSFALVSVVVTLYMRR